MSVDLSCTVDTVDGTSFVACRVRNDADVPRRVRVDSLLDGPVLPPRRSGVPEAGWDRDGVTLQLAPREARGIGFASPAAPIAPPAAVVESDTLDVSGSMHATDVTGVGDDTVEETAAEALRTLETHRPPRAAVHIDGQADSIPPTTMQLDASGRSAGQGNVDSAVSGRVNELDGDAVPKGSPGSPDVTEDANGPGAGADGRDSDIDEDTELAHADGKAAITDVDGGDGFSPVGPTRLDRWFTAVERRIDRAERLADADLDAATDHVVALGGVDAAAALDERVDADAALLRQISDRAADLATRAEATDAPVAALERLS